MIGERTKGPEEELEGEVEEELEEELDEELGGTSCWH
jgi:hypothetical protein